MYDMYPDSWGPTAHRRYRDETWTGDHPAHRHTAATRDEARDHAGDRPDDN